MRNFIKLSSTTVATGHYNGSIKIWDIRTCECLQKIKNTDFSYIYKVANNLIVLANRTDFKILDIKTGNCIKTFKSQKRNIYTLSFLKVLISTKIKLILT